MADGEARIRVGHVDIPYETAVGWVREYTGVTPSTDRTKPSAYPAYDLYERATNDPQRLSDADLMAPTLLNVPVKVLAYYELQRCRERLESCLAHPGLATSLIDLDDGPLEEAIAPLYAVLDAADKPAGVRGTLLSKVLHRKRPRTLVLHDTWVNKAYVSDDGPVFPAKDRQWATYMVALSMAARDDLRTQRDAFQRLRADCGVSGTLSDVRVLDILAWSSKRIKQG